MAALPVDNEMCASKLIYYVLVLLFFCIGVTFFVIVLRYISK
ncbi:putative membrane protein [Candidatus Ichthyocystis hellenicum]|uniref:Putative membrane protein n=1 Tax=Candidatus Ichthyocystis hellenicum TaxID=1561003 RepID=A0A0S4M239_9BURK|nr:putative membrane protein [Candidatus Ichthyocystis hellenicum]